LRAGNVGFRVYKTQKQATDALASVRVAREAQTAQSILTTIGNWGKRMAAWPIESEGFLKLLSQTVLALSDIDVVTAGMSYLQYYNMHLHGNPSALLYLAVNGVMWIVYIGGGYHHKMSFRWRFLSHAFLCSQHGKAICN